MVLLSDVGSSAFASNVLGLQAYIHSETTRTKGGLEWKKWLFIAWSSCRRSLNRQYVDEDTATPLASFLVIMEFFTGKMSDCP